MQHNSIWVRVKPQPPLCTFDSKHQHQLLPGSSWLAKTIHAWRLTHLNSSLPRECQSRHGATRPFKSVTLSLVSQDKYANFWSLLAYRFLLEIPVVPAIVLIDLGLKLVFANGLSPPYIQDMVKPNTPARPLSPATAKRLKTHMLRLKLGPLKKLFLYLLLFLNVALEAVQHIWWSWCTCTILDSWIFGLYPHGWMHLL